MHFKEQLNITGHLQVFKVYPNRPEEMVFDDGNMIVSGMSAGLSHFFAGSGSLDIRDYQIERFQAGSGGPHAGHTGDGTTSAIYALSAPIKAVSEYGGAASQLFFSTNDQITGQTIAAAVGPFAMIPFHKITRIDNTSVRYTLILNEDAANGATISEVGLFMKNPVNMATDASLLVAYRDFTGIPKTSDFSLVFRWTINF